MLLVLARTPQVDQPLESSVGDRHGGNNKSRSTPPVLVPRHSLTPVVSESGPLGRVPVSSISDLAAGLVHAVSPEILLYALIGCIVGTIVGILPGLGPAAAVGMLIPLTLHVPIDAAFVMLAAIFYGASYGGRITAILMKVAGEPSSAVTMLDGYPMATQGRAGVALSITAMSSFVGGMISLVGVVVAAPALAEAALRFGPPEYFALMILALSLISGLTTESRTKSVMAVLLGLALGMVGVELSMGVPRFIFGQTELLSGIPLVPAIVGLMGLSEVFLNLESSAGAVFAPSTGGLWPSKADLRRSAMPTVRGTLVGFIVGLLPGAGTSVASFGAYGLERRVSKDPHRFGKGAIEGVASPEAADNAASNAALIPLLTLGIPASPTVAVLMGALMIHGLTPGPRLFVDESELVWTIIASLIVGNIILLALNLPLVGLWTRLTKVPYRYMYVAIFLCTIIGAYAVRSSAFDVLLMVIFGIAGYFLIKVNVPIAPIVLGFILAPLIEQALRQTLEMSQGDLSILFTRPLSAALLVVTLLAFLLPPLIGRALRSRRDAAMTDESPLVNTHIEE